MLAKFLCESKQDLVPVTAKILIYLLSMQRVLAKKMPCANCVHCFWTVCASCNYDCSDKKDAFDVCRVFLAIPNSGPSSECNGLKQVGNSV